jgi:hypothetical protein
MQAIVRATPPGRLLAGILACCVLQATALAQVTPIPPHPGQDFPDAVNGEEAVAKLGDRADQLAAQHQTNADELIAVLGRNPTLWLTADDQLVYVDLPAAERFQQNDPGSYSGSIPLSQTFFLHTNPGAKKVIHLDFDGHHSKNNGWGHNIQFPAWNTSGSSSSFSNGELQSIINHWLYVAEDFSSWDVDVTTEEPPVDDIKLTFIGDDRYGVRCVMTQITSGFGSGSGGIAVLGSFGGFQDTPVFGFNKGDNTGSMTASHEIGHGMNLFHDGLNGSEYHPGTGSGATSWGPIMGAPFGETVVHFSSGDYAGSTTTQLDLSVIQGNGLGVLPDDFADTVADATSLQTSCPDTSLTSVTGLMARNTDVDTLRFSTSGGNVDIDVTTHQLGPNLDVQLELYTAAGALIASNNPNNQTTASLNQNLSAGIYVIRLEGVGKPGVYSDYGSVGTYTLTVSAPAGSSFLPVGSGLAGTGGLVPLLTGTGIACAGNAVSTTLSNALPNSSAFLVFGIGQLNLPFKGGVLIPDIGLGGVSPLPIGGSGSLSLPTTWPGGVPSGIALDFQYWIQDPGGISGFSASNGVEVLTP